MSDPAPLPYGRDSAGRFTRGNTVAKGRVHAFAKQAAALRQAFYAEVTPGDMRRVVRTLITEATAGNLQAARLLLLWVLGKPAEAVWPDAIAARETVEAQADQTPPPLPAARGTYLDADLHKTLEGLTDPEDRMALAAQALGREIRLLRGMAPAPGGMDWPAQADQD
jgi:hypothetical protein